MSDVNTEQEAIVLLKQAADLIEQAMQTHPTSLGLCLNYIEVQLTKKEYEE